jgi:MerR family mercuric resistance operon transcriptional regulator/MerR family Zn(II)-responsive transcriptional regulator of zntA
MAQYHRKQLASMAGIHMETLRFYEKIRLVEPPARSENGYRIYTDQTLDRLRFIHSAKEAGFTLQEIRFLFEIVKDGPADQAQAARLLDQKVMELGEKITALQKMLETLEKIRGSLGKSDCCPILEIYKKISKNNA